MGKAVTLASVSLFAAALCASSAPAGLASTPSTATDKSTASSKESTAKPATHSVSGTIESYDASSKTLTVKGTKATWNLNAADARVWEGSKSIGLDDLTGHSGSKVSVKYTESAGVKQASSIRLPAPKKSK
jgi:phage baseplate assembly protein gpV